jgi:4-hydroxybenzoate polyprenyltransferase
MGEMSAAPPDGQVLRGDSTLVHYLNLVKLPHTLFALPFTLLGVVAASLRAEVSWRTVGLAVLAFTAARWAAVAFNMLADLQFDRVNPRNRGRVLPQGRLTPRQAWISLLVAAIVFTMSAAAINSLCGLLSVPALAWVLGYSLSKRFTDWPHLWLGLSLAIAPVGGYLAVTGRWSEPWWTLVAVTVAVATWVAGFDIFHALPDEEFDRAHRLRSAVVRLGVPGALRLARVLHTVTVAALLLFGLGAGFGGWYGAGVAVAAAILWREHRLLRAGDLSRLGAAFFAMNAVMSATVLGFALVDRLA